MNTTLVALAGKAVALLTPFVASTAEDFVRTVGQAGYDRSKLMLDRLRERWAGDAGKSVILESFEKQPEPFAPAMTAILEQSLGEDEELRDEVARTVEEVGPLLKIVQRMTEGNDVTGLDSDEVARGRVSITQEIEKGTGVTGARIGRIG
jgi:hypothetical protein